MFVPATTSLRNYSRDRHYAEKELQASLKQKGTSRNQYNLPKVNMFVLNHLFARQRRN